MSGKDQGGKTGGSKLGDFLNKEKSILNKSLEDISRDAESPKFIKSKSQSRSRFLPDIDYSQPSNFARFGSAERYYKDSIERIYKTYPYDGSKHEQEEWFLSSSHLDLYLFKKEYPHATGAVKFSHSGWGSKTGASQQSYGQPADKQYILFYGGPTKGDLYDTSLGRESCLKFTPTAGNTVEFWLKKGEYVNSLTEKEVIFDCYSKNAAGAADTARFKIELDSTVGSSASPFKLTYMSGNVGLNHVSVGTVSKSALVDNKWHHYAFSLVASGSVLKHDFYVDGVINEQGTSSIAPMGDSNRNMIATLGSLVTTVSSQAGLGWGKLSGSLDDFRFWKKYRNPKDVGRFYHDSVNGGTKNDHTNSSLGIYFKFNEGITGDYSQDSTILDYSGWAKNGAVVGYTSGFRTEESAIHESGATKWTEKGDPIMLPIHPKVDNMLSTFKTKGQAWDIENTNNLFNTFPSFMLEEDRGRLYELIQIMSSQFDEIYTLIEHLPKLKRKGFKDVNVSGSASIRTKANSEVHNKTYCDPDYQTENTGGRFEDPTKVKLIPDGRGIFGGADLFSSFLDRDDREQYDYSLLQIRDFFIQNLYNTATEINKRKGTEDSFRNLIRCFGIDDKIIKLNIYADNFEYKVDESQLHTVSKQKSLNCGVTDHFNATVHHNTGSASYTRNYIAGSTPTNSGQGITLEGNVIFPKVDSEASPYYVSKDFETISIFGMHKAELLTENLKVDYSNPASFQVQAVRDIVRPNDVHFRLTSSAGLITELTSSVYQEIYDNKPWNLSIRIKPNSESLFGTLTGSVDKNYTLEFSGYNYDLDSLSETFQLTASLSSAVANAVLAANKRVYMGAHRNNMTGSTREKTDLRFVSLSYWQDYLESAELQAHARDFGNIGRLGLYKNIDVNAGALDNYDIRKNDALALHWNFEMHTASSDTGVMDILDISSGSLDTIGAFGHYGNIVGYQHPGKVQFANIPSKAIMQEFLSVSKFSYLENIHSSDQVQILDLDRTTFKRNEKPITFFYSFEKSMYAAISEEILKYFAGLIEFNNLIGEPVNKYRSDYKGLRVLAQRFFEKSQGDLDYDRFVEFYRWVDDSISKFIDQIKPYSARFSKKILNVVESHTLERNKYDHKFPTIEMKLNDPIAPILGINELLYDWEHGHAPLTTTVSSGTLAAATGKITIMGSSASLLDGGTVTITNTAGLEKVYIFDDDGDGATGTVDGSGRVRVQISGFSKDAMATQLKNAINHDNGHGDTITITGPGLEWSDDGILNFTQATAGSAGNVTITSTVSSGYFDPEGFSGGTGGSTSSRSEKDKCLWWKDRADRRHDIPAAASVDKDRERQRVARNTHASGSTYVLRKLSRPYKFGVTMQTGFRSGQNRKTNKNDEFYKSVSKFGSTANITLPAVDIIEDTYCNDIIDPNYKERFRIKSYTVGVDGYYDRDSDYSLPFSLFSSSAGSSFPSTKAGLIVTNNHHDHYGDDHEIPLQGPFTEAHVGGMPHRHESLAGTLSQARATIQVDTGELGTTTLILKNSGGTTHTITAAALGASNPSTATKINTDLIGNANDATVQMKVSLDAANAAGNIKMNVSTITNNSDGNPRIITLTQFDTGGHGNTPIAGTMVSGNKVLVNSLDPDSAHGELFFTGGNRIERLEAYEVRSDANSITIHPVPASDPRSYYFRDGLAKRPVNIANIKYTTGSAILGNYDRDYQVVLTNGRSLNNNDFVDNEGFSFSGSASTFINEIIDTSKPARTKTEHVIVNRFSNAGPETAADSNGGYSVDVESGEFSAYNTINYKNMNARRILSRLHIEKSEQFGLRSGSLNTLLDYTLTSSLDGPTEIRPSMATSVHMQNRNPHYYLDLPVRATMTIMTDTGTLSTNSLTLKNSDGTTHTISAAALGGGNPSTATQVNTDIVGNANDAATQIRASLAAAATAGSIDMIVSAVTNNSAGDPRVITLTQNHPGTTGNTEVAGSLVSSNKLIINNITAGGSHGELFFTGGANPGSYDYDNFVVYHQIPQNDIQYTWITASSTDTIKTFRGHTSNFTIPSSSGHQYPAEIQFLQKSDHASYWWMEPSTYSRIWGIAPGYASAEGENPPGYQQPVYTDFVGMNANIYEPVSSSINTLGYSSLEFSDTAKAGHTGLFVSINYTNQTFLDGNFVYGGQTSPGEESRVYGVGSHGYAWGNMILNALIQHRQGPYGWPSWKQLRGASHPIMRSHRKNNQYSIHFREGVPSTSPIVDYEYDISPRGSKIKDKSARYSSRVAKNYFDIPVTSKFDPFVMMNFSDSTLRFIEDMGSGTGDQVMENVLWWLTDVSTVFQPDSQMFENMYFAVRDTYTNAISTFSNPEIISALKIDEVTHQPMESMMAAYQDDSRADKPDAFHQINYLEAIYPREINTYTKNARNRENFVFHSWNSDRSKRENILIGSAISAYSDNSVIFPKIRPVIENYTETNSLFVDTLDYKNSGATIVQYITSSAWLLDSRKDFSKEPLSLTASYTSTNASFLANRDQGVRGEGELQNDYSIFGLGYNRIHGTPPPALVYNRRIPQPYGTYGADGYEEYLAGESKWEVNKDSSSPFYDKYTDYNEEIRLVGQNYSLVPEFKISDHIETIVKLSDQSTSREDFNTPLETLLSLTGGVYNTSHGTLAVGSNFYKTYSTSDFLKYFGTIQDSFEESNAPFAPGRLTLKCKGVMKFLPYRGFYPVERTAQIGEIFTKCYLQDYRYKSLNGSDVSDHLDKKMSGSLHHAIKPLMAPGVLYNSIKSGVAVDYPLFENDIRGTKAIGFININLLDASKTAWTANSISSAGTYPKIQMGLLEADGTTTTKTFHFFSDAVDNASESTHVKYVDVGQPPELAASLDRRSASRNTQVARQLSAKLVAAGFEVVDLNYLVETDYSVINTDGSISSGTNPPDRMPTALWSTGDPDFNIGVIPDPGEDSSGRAKAMYIPGVGLVSVPGVGGACIVFRQPYVGSSGNVALSVSDGVRDGSGQEASKIHFSANPGRGVTISGGHSINMRLGAGGSSGVGPGFLRELSTSPTSNSNLRSSLGQYFAGGVTGSFVNNTKDKGIPRIKAKAIKRVSFEDLLDVEGLLGIDLPDNEPHPSASFIYGNQYWYKTFDYPFKFGTANVEHSRESLGLGAFSSLSDYTTYKMAINNFTAETVNFFLKDQKLTSFKSKKINFISPPGVSYKMRVYLHNQDLVMYDRHSAFGPPVDAGDVVKEVRTATNAQVGNKASGNFTVSITDSGGSNHWTLDAQLNSTSNGGNEGKYPGITIPLYSGSSSTNISFLFYHDAANSMASNNTSVKYFINLEDGSGLKTNIEVAKELRIALSSAGFLVTNSDAAKIIFTQPVQGSGGNATLVSVDGGIASNVEADGVVKGLNDGGSHEGYVIAAGWSNPQGGSSASGVEYFTSGKQLFEGSHGFAPYVPPFLDPGADPYVEFTFNTTKEGENQTYSYDDLMSGMTLEYRNFYNIEAQTSSATNFQHAMCLSASLDLKSGYLEPTFEREYESGNNLTRIPGNLRVVIPKDSSSKRWVIQSKWETPLLDFENVPMSVLDLSNSTVNTAVTDSPWKTENWLTYLTHSVNTATTYLTASRGMWHQRGKLPGENKKGYFLSIADVKRSDGEYHPSLAKAVGFLPEDQKTSTLRMGAIAEEKEISEAVVAIPYYCDIHENVQFFKLQEKQIQVAEEENRKIFEMPEGEGRERRLKEVRNPIAFQMRMMKKYIFPPQFDFVQFPKKVRKKEAVAMYVFEFNAKLTKEDLKNIWENTSPTSAESTAMPQHSNSGLRAGSTMDTQYVSHTLHSSLENPLDPRFLKEEVRWLVFKVKYRAEKDYAQVKLNSLYRGMENMDLISMDALSDLSTYNLTRDLQDIHYSYNWPYDFFSLVELVKVEAKVDFVTARDPGKP